MSKFVAEPGEFAPPDAPMPPQTMTDLLALLGVAGAPARTRDAAVRRWLRSNTPGPLLRADLVDDGFVPAERERRQKAAG